MLVKKIKSNRPAHNAKLKGKKKTGQPFTYNLQTKISLPNKRKKGHAKVKHKKKATPSAVEKRKERETRAATDSIAKSNPSQSATICERHFGKGHPRSNLC